ncbi:M20 family metallopeptidase [Planococcus sp. YIM B11945]|uniref:M20 family metallopeptidase n=1 Tax=Planococcus sp. YIM B11945 TaxID=3435410 RepID=UPI003D7EAC76
MNTFFNYLEENKELIKEDLLKLIQSESPSRNKQKVDECGRVLTEVFQKRLFGNWKLESFEQEAAGDHLLFQLEEPSEKPRILYLSHFDTVWDTGVLPIVEKGTDLYGPGVFDMKAGLLSSVWSVRALQQEIQELPFSPVFLFTSDEEVGSETSRPLIEKVASTCDAVLVMEPPVSGSFALKTERKGVGRYTLQVKGVSAHAGNHHEDGVNAILELSKQIVELEKLTDYEKGTTVNVGVVKGGTSSNVVAAFAEADIDFRVTTYEEAEKLIKTIESLQPFNPAAELTLSGELNRPPMEKSAQSEALYQKALIAGNRLGIDIKEAKAGGGSDGNFTAALGIPTLDGLGIPGDGPHALHEHIQFAQFTQRCAFISELCLEIAKK